MLFISECMESYYSLIKWNGYLEEWDIKIAAKAAVYFDHIFVAIILIILYANLL